MGYMGLHVEMAYCTVVGTGVCMVVYLTWISFEVI